MEADRAALEGALAAFRGELTQIPPMYSALKRDGKNLHVISGSLIKNSFHRTLFIFIIPPGH